MQVLSGPRMRWRGAVAGIIEATVSAMRSLGATPHHIVMVIGPGIRQTNYQVSQNMKLEVTAQHETAHTCFIADPAAPKNGCLTCLALPRNAA